MINGDHYINPYSGRKSIVNWGSVITTQALYATPRAIQIYYLKGNGAKGPLLHSIPLD